MKISRWANTQATREVQCPKCLAPAGHTCRTPKGRSTNFHDARGRVYEQNIGRVEYDRRHMGFPGKVVDTDIE